MAVAQAGAAVFTGSTALAAEAAHSLADTANDLSLFVAQRRSRRPADDQHPLGYGREAYFWALIGHPDLGGVGLVRQPDETALPTISVESSGAATSASWSV